ncbi:CRISP3 [Bugula neritina]|uniref:CRISP3 n=1 Tax=Bugula neritina TaxID=10212 RepID=A0A7J7JIE0_BUGNE|nr:CRISP3 [Bugula neritina]
MVITQLPLHAVGHYTQMVWAETTRIGCGVQTCNGSTPFYVCNYGPSGNQADRIYEPYKLGNIEEDCPNKYNRTSGFLW